ncbi:hypothetical protein BWQ96_04453 [Gracilariopsis chorda]|uniref:Uncharacterized protein n=1 Tax=Gracilariopsis chorda TaxID=448386 RepID=A0A2V3IUG8_9FLOR|nr:hypothetical protein BWQ96_04453 [Gracilariopsis chorda]|eukprot:PXF45786.1 hypothetical protein BWQ96_04453 [Gracilariopsis chorda]
MANAKKKRFQERRSADRHLLQAQTISANAAAASIAVAAREAKLFGAFLSL